MARPLTKCEQTGKLYARPPVIEAEIDLALTQDLETLRCRAAVTDRSSPEYLSSECLVHMIRAARRRDDDPMMYALLPALLGRCEANLLDKIPDSGFANAADLREEVMAQFSELFAVDGSGDNSDELDYFECRFNRAFRAFRIDLIRKEISHAKYIAPLPDTSDEEERSSQDDVFARVSEAFRTPARQEDHVFLEEVRKTINALPSDERKAVVLCNILGYQEESEDPKKQTAATLCGVTGRTIRNRLHRAAAKLSKLKEDL
jgi:hypothetical protein